MSAAQIKLTATVGFCLPYTQLQYHVPLPKLAAHPDYGMIALRQSSLSKRSLAKLGHSTELLHPNASCTWQTIGKPCTNPDCRKHGHKIRNGRAAKWAAFDPTAFDVYNVSLAYAGYVTEKQYLAARHHFLTELRHLLTPHGYSQYVFRTEFVNIIPHIHLLFRLPLASDFKAVEKIVRGCWKRALQIVGIWAGQRVGCTLAGKTRYDIWKLSDYIFSTNYTSWRLNNCRPCEWKCKLSFRSRQWSDKNYVETAEDAIATILQGLGLTAAPVAGDCAVSGPLVVLDSRVNHDGLDRTGGTEFSFTVRFTRESNTTNDRIPAAVRPRPPPQWDHIMRGGCRTTTGPVHRMPHSARYKAFFVAKVQTF